MSRQIEFNMESDWFSQFFVDHYESLCFRMNEIVRKFVGVLLRVCSIADFYTEKNNTNRYFYPAATCYYCLWLFFIVINQNIIINLQHIRNEGKGINYQCKLGFIQPKPESIDFERIVEFCFRIDCGFRAVSFMPALDFDWEISIGLGSMRTFDFEGEFFFYFYYFGREPL